MCLLFMYSQLERPVQREAWKPWLGTKPILEWMGEGKKV